MKTLQIKNGDLVIGQGGYATVSGSEKLRQDLGVAVREPYGSDRFHPRWGSLLPSFVGGIITEHTRADIVSEVQRVLGNYMAVQQDQMTSDSANGRKVRFGTGEVVSAVNQIQARQTYDRLHVKVSLTTLSGESVQIVATTGV